MPNTTTIHARLDLAAKARDARHAAEDAHRAARRAALEAEYAKARATVDSIDLVAELRAAGADPVDITVATGWSPALADAYLERADAFTDRLRDLDRRLRYLRAAGK